MRKAILARTLLVAAVCLPAVGVAACQPLDAPAAPRLGVGNGHQPFVISGNLTGSLAPGSSAGQLNLSLSNPNNQAISIGNLTVSVVGTSAGKACDATNFGVVQYSGAYPLNLGALQTITLTQLGVATKALPQVRMIDLPSNQDGCKHVTVNLSYAGTGEGK